MIYQDRSSSELEKKAKKIVGPTRSPEEINSSILQTFPYDYPQRPIDIEHKAAEFT